MKKTSDIRGLVNQFLLLYTILHLAFAAYMTVTRDYAWLTQFLPLCALLYVVALMTDMEREGK